MFDKVLRYQFLFEELVKRDFKQKYKRTVLGMVWSILSPLLTLLVMAVVFTSFFGRTTPHFVVYMFSGNLLFTYFSDATNGGMRSLIGNAGIFTKIDVPKYMFLLSKNVQSLLNFCITLVIYFIFVAADGLPFHWNFFLLICPLLCLMIFNVGVGMILSALYVFFRDIEYLYSIFTMLLMYMSAIFYPISQFSQTGQNLFLLNPMYLFIRYFRKIVIENTIPSLWFHLLMFFFTFAAFGLGCFFYKKYNHRFLYYV